MLVHPGFRFVCPDCGKAVRKVDAVKHRRECEGPEMAQVATAWYEFLDTLPEATS